MSAAELKLCPFCGNAAKISYVYDSTDKYYFYRVDCVMCEASFESTERDDVLSKWNSRKDLLV